MLPSISQVVIVVDNLLRNLDARSPRTAICSAIRIEFDAFDLHVFQSICLRRKEVRKLKRHRDWSAASHEQVIVRSMVDLDTMLPKHLLDSLDVSGDVPGDEEIDIRVLCLRVGGE